MALPLTGIEAGSTDNDEMAVDIATIGNHIATIQAQLSGFILPDHSFHFDHLTARSAEFDYGPLGVAHFIAAQTIPDDTATAVIWSTFSGSTAIVAPYIRPPEPITLSSDATTEIKVVGIPQDHLYLAWGHVQFAANSSGFREVGFTRHYGGSSKSGDTINVAQAVSVVGKVTSIPFIVRWIGRTSSISQEPEHFLTVDVKQDSGGALDMLFASLTITRIY